MTRAVIITNMPAVYRADLFNLLSENDKIDISFLFVPEKNILYKKMIWAERDNTFYLKTNVFEHNSILKKIHYLAHYLLTKKPNKLIIGGIPIYFPIIILLKPFLRYKVFCWWAGNIYTEKKNIFRKIYRKLSSSFIDGYFFYSEQSYKYFNEQIKNIKDNYRIIGNNTRIITTECDHLINSKNLEVKGWHNLVSVGFQDKPKNTKLLLDALLILNKKGLEIKTYIIGDGPEMNNLYDYVDKIKLGNIYFLRDLPQEEVFNKLKESNIFIHPSYADRWPQVYNEAAICGIPILISERAGVTNEYTKKYKNSVLFNPFNANELASKIENIILDKNLSLELGAFVKKVALEHDGTQVANDILKLLHLD